MARSGSFAAWNFTGRAQAIDGEGANALFSQARRTSEELFIYNAGLDIPSNATITGAVAVVDYNLADDQDNIPPDLIQLRLFSEGRGGQSANRFNYNSTPWAPTIGNTYRRIQVGGVNDNWGASLSPAYFNHSRFGIRLQARCDQCDAPGETSRLLIDGAMIHVYYTVPVCTP